MFDQAADGRAVTVGIGEIADDQGLAGAPLGLRLLLWPEARAPVEAAIAGPAAGECLHLGDHCLR